MENILVLGGSGLVGSAVINQMKRSSGMRVFGTYNQRPIELPKENCFKLGIEDLVELENVLYACEPNIIVSCLRGDYEKQLIFHIKVAEYLKKRSGRLYFFSTTNVFDNDTTRPHYEGDTPDAQTEYGKYKIQCEKKIREILCDDACILRIPQVWGKTSPRMLELLEALRNNKKLNAYPNIMVNTNTDVMIARQLCYIIENKKKGIFHLATADAISEKAFKLELSKKLGYDNPSFLEDFEEGQFVIYSNRNGEFPKELVIDNKSVIKNLIS